MAHCKFKSVTGKICDEEAIIDGFCYWHDDSQNKDESNLKNELEQRAKTGKSMRYFKLKFTELPDIDLVNRGNRNGYDLTHSDLYRSNLKNAHLFGLDLSFSSLMKANLSGANLHSVNLEHTNLLGVKLDGAKLEGVQWGEMVRQEWQGDNESDLKKKTQLYSEAEEIYRAIAREMRNQGMTSEINWFTYREMVVRRKQHPQYSLARFISRFIDLYCGYGEKPLRLLVVSGILTILFAFLHGIAGIIHNGELIQLSSQHSIQENFDIFIDALYFSSVTFTTLGYGDISPFGISRFIAATEAFAGSFTIALFVVVFVKRMTR